MSAIKKNFSCLTENLNLKIIRASMYLLKEHLLLKIAGGKKVVFLDICSFKIMNDGIKAGAD